MTTERTAGRIANLVVGLGITGRAVAAALRHRGEDVVAIEDRPTDAVRDAADELGVTLVPAPDPSDVRDLVARADRLLPSPGVPDRHPAMVVARSLGTPIRSELDLAGEWDDRPRIAVTGTNGKTTVTTLVTDMLTASGRRAVAAGNTDVPLVEAIDDPSIDVFVVEASSFRIAHSHRFAPAVATWLNFAPDHLDVHASLEAYEAAKAQLLRDQSADDVAVLNADDPVVMAHAGPARRVTFSPTQGDYRVVDGWLVADDGERIVAVDELPRRQPHDIANALAAAATARAAGASTAAVADVLRAFTGLPHRVAPVGELDGVRYVDDSKATVPQAAVAAISGFDAVVLIAGGKGKGLDPSPLASLPERLRAVVAIGESAPALEALFRGAGVAVTTASSMAEAVAAARAAARPGDVVLLSPGGASQDWYANYGERGDDFARLVRSMIEEASA
ncbi:UDP-N-acetylmuramoyl-L-alanine--D-glutamate ligase [Actinomarinicola tropica]|uniref:UDP-N-acetylmuramoylalanine--D-glutamate ligase n=1 Tax=Actinomarinicola tropica TaxID=2789776 RepID=A0A5Q2RFC9_9ACTN|nr:UDP-N-acetylmuramoyl-L-alanine--D-glutamate ligase [Actinomarinicola tropica]QGG95548.1 UDP-N-acetylmuramoyl-L-alanine--D-glutamate ligase [Actinomarinicola tropica]